jgi:xeroderma pigmentosum group C-complementing protein
LKNDIINKFKNKSTLNLNLQNILQKAEYKKAKGVSSQSSNEREKTPDFDCSAGMKLSDSSDDDDEDSSNNERVKKVKKPTTSNPNDSINEESENVVIDLKSIHDNLERIQRTKEKLSNYNSNNIKSTAAATKSSSQKENVNVADLLAMGENSTTSKSSQKRIKASQGDDSEQSDWESVEGNGKKKITLKNNKVLSYAQFLKHFEYDG